MSILSKLARQFGYELKKHYKVDTPSAASSLVNVLNYYQIGLVLDVGANVGQFGQEIRAEGYQGEIHSFEPVQSTFEQLEAASAQDPKWYVHHCALGASSGKREINVMGSSDLCSFNEPSAFGKERYKNLQVAATEEVTLSTVAEFLEAQGLGGRKFLLKMDTQGHDLEVLAGAKNVISQVVAMQSEISFKPLYSGMPSHLESLKAFDELGYSVAALHTINKSEDLAIIEMDCLVVRRE